MYKIKLSKNERKHYIRDLLLFFILAALPVVVSFIRKLEISDNLAYIKQTDELVLLLMIVFIIKGLEKLMHYKYGILFVFFFILYIINSTLFAVIHSVQVKQAAFQGILDLKLLLVFALVLGIPNKLLFVQRFVQFGKFVMLISFPLVVLQFYSPDYYNSLFPNGGHTGVFKLLDDSDSVRGAGVFWFVGDLAFFSSFFVCYFFFEFIDKRTAIVLFWLLFSSLMLLSTLSRLEIVATISACLYVFTLSQKHLSKKILTLIFSGSVLIIVFIVALPLVEASFERLDLYDPELSGHPRVVFYYSSYILTLENFPFGTGFGTFGGQASVVFGSSLYNELYFNQYWWYRESIAMTDVYWPHIIVEGGVIGLILYFLSISSLFKWAKRNLKQQINLGNSKSLYQSALAILLVTIVNSLASANMNNIYTLFVTLMLLGVVLTEKTTNKVDIIEKNLCDCYRN